MTSIHTFHFLLTKVGSGRNVKWNRKQAMNKTQNPSNGQEMMVCETTGCPWLAVWQSPYHQHGQSHGKYNPDQSQKQKTIKPKYNSHNQVQA